MPYMYHSSIGWPISDRLAPIFRQIKIEIPLVSRVLCDNY